MISALAAAGVFVAIPIAGSLAVGRMPVREGFVGRVPLIVTVGVTLWSVPLLGSLILRAYRPELIGLAGWILVGLWILVRRPGVPRLSLPRGHELILVVGLASAGLLCALAPSEPINGGRDMAVYTHHAIYMAHHGRLDVPYPEGLGTGQDLPDGWVGFSGVYSTEPTMTVQFGHLFPAWLAQTYGVAGYDGLLRLNSLIVVISGFAVFGVARRWMPGHVAVLATLYLAFNAGQVWVVRNTLTEPLTQLYVWTSFLLLLSSHRLRPVASAAWAGVLLGMSAVVRLDSLVIVPLVIFGHALARLLADQRRDDLQLPAFYAGALPVFAVAIGYYVGFSRPYFEQHIPYLWPIAALTVMGGLTYGVTFIPKIASRAARIVTMPRTLILGSAAILVLAVFAYFIRPFIEPFDRLVRAVAVPPRSFVEEAMRNLGTYLTPPVLWMGVVGWLATTVNAVRDRIVTALPVLIIVGGFSALYFWDQAITPDHFWAIRRFVPIVMPAAVIFAGAVGWFVLAHIRLPWRRIAFGLAVVVLAAQTWRIGTPMYFVAERAGVYQALGEFADALPDDETYLALMDQRALHTSGTTLFMAFDQDLVPIAVELPEGREEAIERLRQASPGDAIPVITEFSDDPAALIGPTIADIQDAVTVMGPTVNPVPQLPIQEGYGLAARVVTGATTLGWQMDQQIHWLVGQDGFFPPEVIDDHTARWTDGDAELRVPIFSGPQPERLAVDFEWMGPVGATLELTYGGTTLFAGERPPDPWSAIFDLPPGATIGDEVTIELNSSTFVPAETIENSRDIRRLGVMLRSIRLLGPEG